MLNIPFPINRMITYFGQTLRTAVNSKINTGKVLVLLNFEAFLNTKIAGISINDFVIFSNQIYSFGNIMLVCRRNRDGMNQTASGVYANMALHAKAPYVAFSGLVHLRIACFLRIFMELGASIIVASTIVPPFIISSIFKALISQSYSVAFPKAQCHPIRIFRE